MQWVIIGVTVLALVAVALWWRKRPQRMPDNWPLAMRKVFSQDEQKAYVLMRSAFPELCILVKLPLSRFLQLTDTKNMRYWFDLISPLFVTFAVCAPDGKVLAVVDFESSKRPGSRSALTLKRRAFQTCKLMYFKHDYETMPSARSLRVSVLGPASLEILDANDVTPATPAPPVSPQSLRKLEDMAAATAKETEIARAQLEQIVKDKRHMRDSTNAKDKDKDSWTPDSILGRDSFLRPDAAKDDNVDIVIH